MVIAACSHLVSHCSLACTKTPDPTDHPPVTNATMPKAATKKEAPAKKEKKEKKAKDPNAPKKPSGPYIFFCNAKRGEIKKDNPDFGVAQIGKELGVLWKAATDKDKEPFFKQAEKDKERYAKAMESYTPPEPAEEGEEAPAKKAKKERKPKKVVEKEEEEEEEEDEDDE
ncbi:hypothetical protein WJX72_005311 [[Myrmecia] bisecta]|uniref:HMG box domain-containing protein n=1 Tax=[Myrmecia] bisecta TaxID=41462 RepID=A0AAW1P009_9CHLO